MKIINIPFMGFYGTHYDGMIDREIEHAAYNMNEDDDRLTEAEYCDIIFTCTDHQGIFNSIAEDYVQQFNDYFEEHTGIDLGLKFMRLVSPKEYNFTTDQIDAYISLEKVTDLAAEVDVKILAETIRDRHTSRSGFISFYSNDIDVWLSKSLEEWDHNELCTLLSAVIRERLDDDWDYHIFEKTNDYSYEYIDAHVDWDKVERLKMEELAERAEEI